MSGLGFEFAAVKVAKTIDTNAAEDFLEEMNAAHARVMKNLIDTSNSSSARTNLTNLVRQGERLARVNSSSNMLLVFAG